MVSLILLSIRDQCQSKSLAAPSSARFVSLVYTVLKMQARQGADTKSCAHVYESPYTYIKDFKKVYIWDTNWTSLYLAQVLRWHGYWIVCKMMDRYPTSDFARVTVTLAILGCKQRGNTHRVYACRSSLVCTLCLCCLHAVVSANP